MLELGVTATTVVLLIVLAVLVVVPWKYVYPSRTETLWYANMAGATAWLVVFGVITALLPDVPLWLTLLSMAYLAYYLVESLWLTFRSRSAVASTSVQPAP